MMNDQLERSTMTDIKLKEAVDLLSDLARANSDLSVVSVAYATVIAQILEKDTAMLDALHRAGAAENSFEVLVEHIAAERAWVAELELQIDRSSAQISEKDAALRAALHRSSIAENSLEASDNEVAAGRYRIAELELKLNQFAILTPK